MGGNPGENDLPLQRADGNGDNPFAQSLKSLEEIHQEPHSPVPDRRRTETYLFTPDSQEEISFSQSVLRDDEENSLSDDQEIFSGGNYRTDQSEIANPEFIFPHSQKEQERFKMDSGLKIRQCTSQPQSLQDGDHNSDQRNDPRKRLDGEYRHRECLLSLTDTPRLSPILPLQSSEQDLPVQGSPDGSERISLGPVEDNERIYSEDSSERNQDHLLCRRHSHNGTNRAGVRTTQNHGAERNGLLRYHTQPQQVTTDSEPVHRTSRFPSRHGTQQTDQHKRNQEEASEASQEDFESPEASSEDDSEPLRFAQSCLGRSPHPQMAKQIDRKRSQPNDHRRLERTDRTQRIRQRYSSDCGHQLSPQNERLQTHVHLEPIDHADNGCEPTRMGCDSTNLVGQTPSPDDMDARGALTDLEPERTTRNHQSILCVQAPLTQELRNTDFNGQHLSSQLRQRQGQAPNTDRDCQTNDQLGFQAPDNNPLHSHSGEGEHGGRSTITEIPATRSRLDSITQRVQEDHPEMGPDGLRPVRRLDQQQDSQFCLVASGSQSCDHRQSNSPLVTATPTVVHRPTLATASSSNCQDSQPKESRSLPMRLSGPFVERIIMVSNTGKDSDRIHDSTQPNNHSGSIRSAPHARPIGTRDDSSSDNLASALISIAQNSEQERIKQNRVKRFQTFAAVLDLPDEVEAVCTFLAEAIIGRQPERYPVYQTFSNYLSAIDKDRKKRNLPLFADQERVQNLVEAAKKLLPRCSGRLNDPGEVYDPKVVVQKALKTYLDNGSYKALRLVGLLAFRTSALLRAKDVHSIKRSSIKSTTDMRGQRILIFDYCGKSAKKAMLTKESNFVEFLHPSLEKFCPATLILKLKNEIDKDTTVKHDSIMTFLREKNKTLQPQSINPLIEEFLKEIGIHGHTGHSIRAMTSEYLELSAGVDADQICLRGWKFKSLRPNTRTLSYRSRITTRNFSDILWNPNQQVEQLPQSTTTPSSPGSTPLSAPTE